MILAACPLLPAERAEGRYLLWLRSFDAATWEDEAELDRVTGSIERSMRVLCTLQREARILGRPAPLGIDDPRVPVRAQAHPDRAVPSPPHDHRRASVPVDDGHPGARRDRIWPLAAAWLVAGVLLIQLARGGWNG